MIVYVESNFVLEIAYFQEQLKSCQYLLDLARAQTIELAIPAFALTEPYETSVRRSKQRAQLNLNLVQELHQLARSSKYREHREKFNQVLVILTDSIDEQKTSLDSTVEQILSVARTIPVTPAVVLGALTNKDRLSLTPQDAFVYSSVLTDLQSSPVGTKCFITKNKKDFESSDIERELLNYECKLFWTFDAGLGYTRSKS